MHSFEREMYYELSNLVPQLKKYLFIIFLRTLIANYILLWLKRILLYKTVHIHVQEGVTHLI